MAFERAWQHDADRQVEQMGELAWALRTRLRRYQAPNAAPSLNHPAREPPPGPQHLHLCCQSNNTRRRCDLYPTLPNRLLVHATPLPLPSHRRPDCRPPPTPTTTTIAAAYTAVATAAPSRLPDSTITTTSSSSPPPTYITTTTTQQYHANITSRASLCAYSTLPPPPSTKYASRASSSLIIKPSNRCIAYLAVHIYTYLRTSAHWRL